MIFIIFDLLEKILNWLRPYKEKSDNLTDNIRGGTTWSADNFRSFRTVDADTLELPVVGRLLELKSDTTINVKPKATGTIYDLDGKFVYGPETVGRRVWGTLFGEFGRQYQFYLKKDR